jgi:hypothetical protein
MPLLYYLDFGPAILAAVLLPENLPEVLRQGRRFVLWRHLFSRDETKPRKVPFQVNGQPASHSDCATWSDLATVWREYLRRPFFWSGMMRAFTPEDGITGIDADNCFPAEQGDTAEITPWGRELVERLGARTYYEESVSGRGLHFFGYAVAPRCGQWAIVRQGNGSTAQIEVYDRTRFFVMTGAAGPDVPRVLADIQADIDALVTTLDRVKQRRDTQPRRAYSPSPAAGFWTPHAAMNLAVKVLGRYGITSPIEHPRHPTLVRLLGSLWTHGVSAEVAEYVLNEINHIFCRPPYSAKHIAAMVRSAQKWDRV